MLSKSNMKEVRGVGLVLLLMAVPTFIFSAWEGLAFFVALTDIYFAVIMTIATVSLGTVLMMMSMREEK
jgi:hypothetical protein